MNIGTVLVGAGAAALPEAAAGRAQSPAVVPAAATAIATQRNGGLLGGILGSLNQASAQRYGEQFGSLLTRFTRSALTGAASGAAASSTTGTSGSLSFLKDAKLSVEEKLARLMVYLSDKYEKQLEQKLQQYASLEDGKGTTSSSGSSKKSSTASSLTGALTGGLSSLVSKAGLGSVFGGAAVQKLVGQLAGPVLAGAATALGMPTLAPALLKAGPLLGSFAAGAASALADEAPGKSAKGASTSKGATSSGSTSSSSGSAPSEKQLMTEIQILQEKQKEMFTLVSNILRSLHDTKMAVISNVR